MEDSGLAKEAELWKIIARGKWAKTYARWRSIAAPHQKCHHLHIILKSMGKRQLSTLQKSQKLNDTSRHDSLLVCRWTKGHNS